MTPYTRYKLPDGAKVLEVKSHLEMGTGKNCRGYMPAVKNDFYTYQRHKDGYGVLTVTDEMNLFGFYVASPLKSKEGICQQLKMIFTRTNVTKMAAKY